MDLTLATASALALVIAIPLIIGLLVGWFLWGRRLTETTDELQSEIERRATSEGQVARVPELQQELARREERVRDLGEKLMAAEAQKQAVIATLDSERREAEERVRLWDDAKKALADAFSALSAQALQTN